jgi:hypothetical protein
MPRPTIRCGLAVTLPLALMTIRMPSLHRLGGNRSTPLDRAGTAGCRGRGSVSAPVAAAPAPCTPDSNLGSNGHAASSVSAELAESYRTSDR